MGTSRPTWGSASLVDAELAEWRIRRWIGMGMLDHWSMVWWWCSSDRYFPPGTRVGVCLRQRQASTITALSRALEMDVTNKVCEWLPMPFYDTFKTYISILQISFVQSFTYEIENLTKFLFLEANISQLFLTGCERLVSYGEVIHRAHGCVGSRGKVVKSPHSVIATGRRWWKVWSFRQYEWRLIIEVLCAS
jgi:hypothetical protein